MTEKTPAVVLAGLGNEFRRDDGAGQLVAAEAARRLRRVVYLGSVREPMDLCGKWDRAQAAVLVDAVRSGAAAGRVHVVELAVSAEPGEGHEDCDRLDGARTSTHGLGLPAVLRLASAMGQAPERVVLVGLEGQEFGPGPGLSSAVQAAVPIAVARVVMVVEELLACV
jgi:hydrogenase maturation protease